MAVESEELREGVFLIHFLLGRTECECGTLV